MNKLWFAVLNSSAGQELTQPRSLFWPQNHPGIPVTIVYLPKQFAAPAAWRQDSTVLINCHNHSHIGLAGLQHFGDSGVLGAESKTASGIHTDTREYS
jgi:hypothetical protein